MVEIVILQPYVPVYRKPFFHELALRLRSTGHELLVVSGEPGHRQKARQDSVMLDEVRHVTLPTRRLRLGRFELRAIRSRSALKNAGVVVAELAAGSLDTYAALLSRRKHAVLLWGHVGGYVKHDGWATRLLKRWQVRRADGVLAYTASGVATAVGLGAEPKQVTVLNNSVDTRSLRALVLRARELEESAVRSRLGVSSAPLLTMIGGIDETKRMDLVVGALDALWSEKSPIKLIVGGKGPSESSLDAAKERGQVLALGYLGDEEKALIARVAIGILNPGRVGLIAVESFVLGLPIITTHGARHAPEFEYLRPGSDSIVVDADPHALAEAMMSLTSDGALAARLSAAADARAGQFSVQEMATAMATAIEKAALRVHKA